MVPVAAFYDKMRFAFSLTVIQTSLLITDATRSGHRQTCDTIHPVSRVVDAVLQGGQDDAVSRALQAGSWMRWQRRMGRRRGACKWMSSD